MELDRALLQIGGNPVTLIDLLVIAAVFALLLLIATMVFSWRAQASRQQTDRLETLDASLNRLFATLTESSTKVEATATIGDDLRGLAASLNALMSGFSFRRETGISFGAWRQQARLAEAIGGPPTPGVNTQALAVFADQAASTMFGLYDMFSGGNLSQVTIFALGVMPYISASIILQLLTVVWPYMEKLSKEGELGRRKITQYTRYGTILLSVVQSLGIAYFLERQTQIAGGLPLVYHPGIAFRLMTVLTLTTGTCFVMWLGEQITERGIGNGMSLIIFSGIVVGFPRAVIQTFDQLRTGQLGLISIVFLLIMMAFVVAAIIFVERGHRRGTVQYAKRVVGRRMYGGSSTHIPLKVNTGGVIPVIFASSILAFPATFAQMFQGRRFADAVVAQLGLGMPLYNLLFVAGIIFFAYFYTAIIFNPDDVAENMRKYGGFIPGIRPGKATSDYIDTVLTRITLIGACYLVVVALIEKVHLEMSRRGVKALIHAGFVQLLKIVAKNVFVPVSLSQIFQKM